MPHLTQHLLSLNGDRQESHLLPTILTLPHLSLPNRTGPNRTAPSQTKPCHTSPWSEIGGGITLRRPSLPNPALPDCAQQDLTTPYDTLVVLFYTFS